MCNVNFLQSLLLLFDVPGVSIPMFKLISVQCAELHFYFLRFALWKYTIIIILLQAIDLVNFLFRDHEQSTKGPTDMNGVGCG